MEAQTIKKDAQTEKSVSLIAQLEKLFDSKVIVYVTGERAPLTTQIALDILPKFQAVLKSFPNDTKKITLLLNTNGGNIDTPWPLVSDIRECCEIFNVVVIHKALSSGTLIALGADNIFMPRFSHLSPIDPATYYSDEQGQMKKLEIEDTVGYIDFIKNKVGITEQNALAELTKELTREVGSTRLGSVNRTHSLIRNIAKNLLSVHVIPLSQRDQKDIIEHLAEKLYAHGHLISKKEAQKIGFESVIKDVTEEQEKLLEQLWREIDSELKNDEPFTPERELAPGEDRKDVIVTRGIIYSEERKYQYNSYYTIMRSPGSPEVNIAESKSLWEEKVISK